MRNRAAKRKGTLVSVHSLPVGNPQGKFMGCWLKSESEKRRRSVLRDKEVL